MNADDWAQVFSVGGPLMLAGTGIAWIVNQYRTSQQNRTNRPRQVAESDSVIVAATRDVVTMIRTELDALTKAKKETDQKNETLEDLVERLERLVGRLRTIIVDLRKGNNPPIHPDEKFPEDGATS